MSLKDTRQAMTVILEMSREVAEGRRYILFPEGGYVVGRKNGMGEFKAGCFKISLKTKTPIVPVVLWDSYKVYNSWEFRPVKTEVHFLKPIPYEEFKDMNTLEIAAMVQGKIQDKLDELKKEKEK
ncbi:MAG: 1-acyl-sn-glycerol-3-phosphate acyltransferase [Lachnospiraceae bacterium]|nr:1-acyl-sn-glycerol-3-phosphate acyltransferase [Lachnospiraceae bacterium]